MKPFYILLSGIALTFSQCVAVYTHDLHPDMEVPETGTPDRERVLPTYYRSEPQCLASAEFAYWLAANDKPYCYNRGIEGWPEWEVQVDYVIPDEFFEDSER